MTNVFNHRHRNRSRLDRYCSPVQGQLVVKKLLFAVPLLAVLATGLVEHMSVASVTLNPTEQGVSPMAETSTNPFIQPTPVSTAEPVTTTPSAPQTDAVTEDGATAQDVPQAPTVAPTPTPGFNIPRLASNVPGGPGLSY